ncbi:transporter, partial [Klebsiella pneumoniae]|nr:transporter [Klebsiella pneumoniae]
MNNIYHSLPGYEKFNESVPFTKYDAGWVVLCIGMAIGSGIVFMPVQIGIKGIWVL